ncbi:extracellular solute-binding protein [Paenibacillus sp. ACRSA]|uniref:extracellular solute-binding protein n=1 Tax=Paenibacillus sp. ACRSA TaxID=2918211 RepID=UPI001EF6EAA7|nr:extracellular solute-binding protein [Paenibacillus sp. ACRSA]MCG7379765.1 extracellular solute-binding protein [Paenibacillus sp. ACRSA]
MILTRKYLVMISAIALLLTVVLSGCSSGGNKESSLSPAVGDDSSTPVQLKMIMLGPKPVDYEKVYTELNQKLKEKINTTVSVEFLDWSDWAQKYPLKFAANEDFDLIYTANWAFYTNQATMGGFLELTDEMLQKYAPQTWENMPKVSWNQAKVEGKLYMVPNNHVEVTDGFTLIREDLRKKNNLPEVNSLDTLAIYLKTIAKNEQGIIPFNASANGGMWNLWDNQTLLQKNNWRLIDPGLPLAFKLDDLSGKLFNVAETPEYKEILEYYKDLADNGAWPRNIVNNKNDGWQEMKAGKVAAGNHNVLTLGAQIAEAKQENRDMEFKIVDITPNSKVNAAISTQNGTAIHSTSKNPERALMFNDLLQNDKEIHDLAMYGIAGEHYIPEGEDKYSAGPRSSQYPGYSVWGWNSHLNRENVNTPQEALDIIAASQSNLYHYPLESFVLVDTKVKNEIANIGNVMMRYNLPLGYGIINDLNKGQQDLINQLKAAGIDKVKEEIQSQIDNFLAGNS